MCRSVISSDSTLLLDSKTVHNSHHLHKLPSPPRKEVATPAAKSTAEINPPARSQKHHFKPEDRRKISLAIRQQNAALFVRNCQQDSLNIQPLINSAKQQVMRQIIKKFQPTIQPPATSPQAPRIQPKVQAPACACGFCKANINSDRALVNFVWSGEARSVDLRLDVDGWNTPHAMARSQHSGDWVLALPIPTMKRVQFKFIVDGVWQTHSRYSVCQDNNGNTNNCILAVTVQYPASQVSFTDVVVVSSQVDAWASQMSLHRCSATQNYMAPLILPGDWAGSFEFKFVVNGEWKVSMLHLTRHNGAFENNALYL